VRRGARTSAPAAAERQPPRRERRERVDAQRCPLAGAGVEVLRVRPHRRAGGWGRARALRAARRRCARLAPPARPLRRRRAQIGRAARCRRPLRHAPANGPRRARAGAEQREQGSKTARDQALAALNHQAYDSM
jgi:hypothetical protein